MPTHYLLTINFDEEGLRTLKAAGQNVVIVRCVEPARPEQLAWVSFFPRLVSTVTWTEEDVRLYCFSQSEGWPLQPGTRVFMNMSTDFVAPGSVYSFSDEEGFRKVSDAGSADHYTLVRAQGQRGIFGFGLAQAGTVFADDKYTKTAPLNVFPVPSNTQVPFGITKRVQVFTAAAEASVVLGNEARGVALEVDFSQRLQWEIRYDSQTNSFQFV